ncbi:MAG TPA: MBG domain-containing protein [Rhizomicrobium sp.]
MNENRSFLMILRSGKWSIASRIVAMAAMHGLCANAYAANVLPTGGQYVAGSGAISTASKSVVVNQSSKTGIVNWQGFSIGSGNTVQFNNGSGATLNRVTGGNLSQIDGMLKASGSIYLINPQGIVVGPGGKIVTNGSFVGSTRDVSDDDFMKGKALHASGMSSGTVINQGSITSLYGDTILVGSSVRNSGSVSAPNGTAGLAAGNEVTLRPAGSDPRIAVSAGKGDVTNTGTVAAAQAELVSAGGNVYALAGNSGGLISATGSKTVDGHVWLTSSGTTQISGTMTAANAVGTGGTIVATGKNVQVDATARISANGTTGGTILVGGDQKGGSDPSLKRVSATVANARTTTVAKGAQISADGTQNAGGAVVIWSDDHTIFDGGISAAGTNGNGGNAEVSSHGVLDFTGLVDLTSKYADIGDLLLDPYAVTIVAGAGGTISSNKFTPTANSNLGATTLTTALGSANVTVNTGTGGSGSGSITLSSGVNLTWTSGSTLTLDASARAAGTIALNGAITATNGGLNIKAGSSATVTDTAAIAVKNFTLTSGNWSQNTASLPSFTASNFIISGGTFLRVKGGNGSSSPYQVADIYGLQGMIGFGSINFSLANDIDASTTATWNSGQGFMPLSLDSGMTFDGQNHSITGLTINQSASGGSNVGLFANNYGTIQNLKLVGGTISGTGGAVGAVAGQNGSQEADFDSSCNCYVIVSNPGYIKNVTSSATVNGAGYSIGGLTGINYGSITGSVATGAVNGADGSDGSHYAEQVGGLAGFSSGTIDSSSASGNVSGFDTVGGLVGENTSTGSVTNSHASGTITVPAQSYPVNSGGLVGENDGLIDTTYATGDVNGSEDPSEGSTYLGGLVGVNRGTIKNSNASGDVTGQSYIGGLVGGNGGSDHYISTTLGGTILNSYATGDVTGISNVGGLAGANGAVTYYDSNGNYTGVAAPVVSSITGSYATGTVSGTQSIGGLVGYNQAGTITGSHAGGTIIGVASTDPWSGYTNYPYDVGGLVGENDDTIIASYANTTVTANFGNYTGGLVGNNTGSISKSYSQGTVSGYYWTGGLAGENTGTIDLSHSSAVVNGGDISTGGLVGKNGDQYAACSDPNCTSYSIFNVPGVITNSYATGNVTATGGLVGGLVGDNFDTITASYASGAVSGGYYVGGLVGTNEQPGTIQRAYATGAVTGSSYSVGGAIGINYGSVTDAYATGSVTGTSGGDCCLGGFVADNEGSITNVYSTGVVIGPNYYYAGALVGWNGGFSNIGNITTSYWNSTVANGLAGVGADTTASHQGQHAKGLTSAQMQVSSNFVGFDFTNTWAPAGNGFAPQLYGVSYVVRVDTAGSYQYGDPIQSTFYGLQNGDLSSIITGLVTTTNAPGRPQVGQVYTGSASGATATSSSGAAYRFIYNNGAINITPRQITIQADDISKTYGQSDPTLTWQITGGSLLSGDTITGALGRDAGNNAGTYDITQGSLAINSNYTIDFLGATFTINPATLTYTANTASRTYGSSNPTFSGTVTGFVNGDTLLSATSGTLSFLSSATGSSNAGSYAINGSGLTANNGNYVFVQAAGNANALTINPAQLIFTANSTSRAYGSSNGTLSGTITGYVLGQGQSNVFNSTNWTSTAGTTTDVGNYLITGNGSFKSGMSGNYVIVQAASNSTALTITPKTLTWSITGGGSSSTYGTLGSLGTVSLSGVVTGDTSKVSGVTGLFDSNGVLVAYVATTDAGSYTEKAASLTGTKALDYVLATTGTTKAFTINPKQLTYSVGNASGTYGTIASLGTVTLTGVLGADSGLVSGTADLFSGPTPVTYAFNTAAGTYTEKVTGLAGTKSGNYSIAASGNTNGTFTINKATLTYSTADVGGTYGTVSALGAITFSGLVAGDGSNIVGTEALFSGATPVSYVFNTGVGGYLEKVTGISGTGVSNYQLASSGNTIGTFTIAPLAITVTADDKSRKYGNVNPTLTYQITSGGLVAGDSLTGALTTGATATSDVGDYAIAQGTLAASANYNLTYVPGTLTIAARTLDISADDKSRLYGDANPSFTYQITGGDGLVNGDELTGSLATVADTHSGVGNYAITQGALTAGDNYAIDFTNGTLAVTARALDISADNKNRLYGDANPSFTYQITGGDGLVNGDTLSGALTTAADGHSGVGTYDIAQGGLTGGANYNIDFTNGTLTIAARSLDISADNKNRLYGDANPALTYQITGGDGLVNGDGLSGALTTAADTRSNVGDYGITQGSLAAGGNYVISFTDGTLSVTPRTLTVTADALSRIYGNANPALTYALSGDGLVNGDTLSGGLATAADASSSVGNYPITQGTLAASSNYALSYIGATLAVTARPLTITADDLSRMYGDANPALTYVVGGDGLVNGDALTGALATVANGASNVGNYAIGQGTLAASSNYAVTYVGGTLAVTPRNLTITADDLSRLYGDANPALTYTIGGSGLVNGDTLTGGLATAAGLTSNIGNYAITQGSLAASSNYAVTYVGGTLVVAARPITITADDLSRIYGDANPALTYTIGGSGLANGDTLTGSLATTATGTSNVDSYAITQGSLAASSNYAVTYVGGSLSVTPRAITVMADDLSRLYGSANPLLTYVVGGDGLVNGDTLTGTLATSAGTHSNIGNYAIAQGSLAASSNYVLTFAPGTLAITPAALIIVADNISALSLDQAHPTASYIGLVAGDTSAVVSGLKLGLFPIDGNPFGYDIVPFGASAQNYAISFRAGLLTLTAQPPGGFTTPVTPGGPLGALPNLVLVTPSGTFSFSNVATAALGGDNSIVLFDAGLPGEIGSFNQFVITDYSNATNDNDRLVAAE